MKKRIPMIFLSCMLFCTAGYTQTIGFICMYNGDAPAGTADVMTTLETELFEQCFDHGIIATSVEHIVGKPALYNDTASLIKLFDSSIDYLVAVYCEYRLGKEVRQTSQKQVLEWTKLQWKIVDFSLKKVLFEDDINPAGFGDPELKQKARDAGTHIGAAILEKV